MKILVVGNGFDLAHKLRTSYWNCLDFLFVLYQCEHDFTYWRSMLWRNSIRHTGLDQRLQDFSEYQVKFLREYAMQINSSDVRKLPPNAYNGLNSLLYKCISDNLWLEYFWEIQKANHEQGQKWVDFESELSRVIQKVDNKIKDCELNGKPLYNTEHKFFLDLNFVNQPYLKIFDKKIAEYVYEKFNINSTTDEIKKGIIDMLYENLLKITTAIEIYLQTCVRSSPINCLPYFFNIGLFDKVISFNYTNTFTTYLKAETDDNICHIHGSIREKISDINTPLVLGIDEYLSEDTRDRDIDWIMFKKFFQRIYRRSDYKYKGWSEFSPFSNTETQQTELYIIGHSLDVTDQDVLRDLILRENQITKIFYRNSTQLASELKNLIRIIGSEELNRRCRSVPPSIVFIRQQPSPSGL